MEYTYTKYESQLYFVYKEALIPKFNTIFAKKNCVNSQHTTYKFKGYFVFKSKTKINQT